MQIIKSVSDYRNYSYTILDNQLEFVFIHDPKASTSSVSLSVGTGSYDDTIEGIAHFLEHMLFMGNEKYPNEKYYSDFVNSHNGYCNAYTAGDHTNYFYTIDPNYLLKSLDIFSQFFICPLFDNSCISREMKAVDSEHKKNILVDGWRNLQMIKTLCTKDSPLCKFSTGNLDTLNITNIREKMIEFFNSNYSSNIMKLVILYNNDFDNTNMHQEFINDISQLFSKIKNKNVNIIRSTKNCTHLMTNNYIKVIPIKDENLLKIVFSLPICHDIINNNILKYISYLINHQGVGTLYNYLYTTGYIESMHTYEECTIDNCSLFSVIFKLPNNSKELQSKIISSYKKYIDVLLQSIYSNKMIDLLNEDRFLINQNFDNFEITSEDDFVSSLSSDLINYKSLDRHYLLKYNYLIGEFINENEFMNYVKNILTQINLSNNNFSIFNISKSHKQTDNYLEEQYYKIKYNISELSMRYHLDEDIQLQFPQKNLFLVKETKLLKDTNDDIPKKIHTKNNIKLYAKRNYALRTTDMQMFIHILKTDIYCDIRNFVSYLFLLEFFKLENNSLLHDIISANYKIDISINSTGIIISVNGYYEHIDTILQTLMNKFIVLINNLDKCNFDLVKNKLIRNCRNKKYNPPYQKLSEYENKLLMDKYYDTTDIEDMLLNLNNYNDLQFDFFTYQKCIIYCEGNFTLEMSNKYLETIINYFNYKSTELNNQLIDMNKINQLIENINVNSNSEDENECSYVSIFIDTLYKSNDWMDNYTKLQIFDLIISQDFFNQLRTIEQLGYITNATYNIIRDTENQILRYKFIVQSSTKNSKYLTSRIFNFIKNNIIDIVNNTPDNIFNEIKNSIKEKLMRPHNNLTESALYNFDKIINKNFMFNLNKIIASKLDTINKQDIICFYDKYFKLNKYELIEITKKN